MPRRPKPSACKWARILPAWPASMLSGLRIANVIAITFSPDPTARLTAAGPAVATVAARRIAGRFLVIGCGLFVISLLAAADRAGRRRAAAPLLLGQHLEVGLGSVEAEHRADHLAGIAGAEQHGRPGRQPQAPAHARQPQQPAPPAIVGRVEVGLDHAGRQPAEAGRGL